METKKKQERNSNFTFEETEKLILLVESKVHIIENKRSDAVSWQEKRNAWQAIEKAFNRSGRGPYRDSKHLKLKYEALKRDTRKKINLIRGESIYKIGGETSTPTPLTPVELKVKEMISSSFEVGEGESTFDFDYDPPTDQLSEPIEQHDFNMLADAKIEIASLQKHVIHEEMKEKALSIELLKLEREHKIDLYKLEKQHMQLKIDILKLELEKAKQK